MRPIGIGSRRHETAGILLHIYAFYSAKQGESACELCDEARLFVGKWAQESKGAERVTSRLFLL
jgi:hypothetical protein